MFSGTGRSHPLRASRFFPTRTHARRCAFPERFPLELPALMSTTGMAASMPRPRSAFSSVLESKISSPADGAFITKPTTISGYALGSGFASYTLQYGAGTSPSSWTTIQTATSPVAGRSAWHIRPQPWCQTASTPSGSPLTMSPTMLTSITFNSP